MITSSASPTSERRATPVALACLAALVAVFSLGVAHGVADGAPPADGLAELQDRLDRLSRRDDAAYVEGATGQARSALERAEDAADDPEKQARARETARAALTLAERQLELRSVQVELIATQRRLTALRERAAAQRRVLEALMRERASLARGGDAP